jgi:hypothetical protein
LLTTAGRLSGKGICSLMASLPRLGANRPILQRAAVRLDNNREGFR